MVERLVEAQGLRGFDSLSSGVSTKEYYAAWHQANRDRRMPLIKERKRKHKEEMRVWVRDLKSTTPCADCQLLFPYYVMDFDHVTDDKEKAISVAMNQGWSKSKLEEEIAKCELVCANCHRLRTHERSVVEQSGGLP